MYEQNVNELAIVAKSEPVLLVIWELVYHMAMWLLGNVADCKFQYYIEVQQSL